MDTFRYGIAVLTLATLPPAMLYWFVIHPFIGFWRRRGTTITYIANISLFVLVGYLVYRSRAAVLGPDYGTNPILVGVAALLYVSAIAVEVPRRRQLTTRMLVGLPELEAVEGSPGRLLEEGIYSKIRHPRYVGMTLGVTSVAFFCNYLATWILLAALFPALYLLVVIEERELRARFGDEYARYSERVPRFIPRRAKPGLGGGQH